LGAQAQQAGAAAQALAAQASGMQTMSLGWAAAGSDGLAKVTGDDYGVGYTLGAIWEFDAATRIGFNYRSKIFHDITGHSEIQLPGNAASAPTQFTSLLPAYQNASLKLTLPDSANVSIYHDINEQWAVMASAEWTGWSSLQTLNVIGQGGSTISSMPENWKDTYYLAAGVNYKPVERWTLHFGVAYDQAPLDDQTRTARIPDADRYWVAGGVSYAVTPKTNVNFGYAHLFTPGGNITDGAGAAEGGGVLTGTYKDSVDIVSASFAMRF
jgi:long-chain fatty acid transport protein